MDAWFDKFSMIELERLPAVVRIELFKQEVDSAAKADFTVDLDVQNTMTVRIP